MPVPSEAVASISTGLRNQVGLPLGRMLFRSDRIHLIALLGLTCCSMGSHAQQLASGCAPYLRFQIQVRKQDPSQRQALRPEALQGTISSEALSVVSLLSFSLTSPKDNTLSLLVIVWNGGLQVQAVEKFAASLRKEERLHLRLSTLTRSKGQSSWTDNPAEQRKLLDQAAVDASYATADEPGFQPKTSDGRVLGKRWDESLRVSVEDTLKQPGKQVILELLPPPPLRPPYGAEHWRIPTDRDYLGEPQVHTFAALGVVPVYRVHNDTPALTMIIPGGDASNRPPFGGGGDVSSIGKGQEQLTQVRDLSMRDPLPPSSKLFWDLGGRDVYEAREALNFMLADLKQVYTVVAKSPASCTPRGIVQMRLKIVSSRKSPISLFTAPQWAAFYLLGKQTADN